MAKNKNNWSSAHMALLAICSIQLLTFTPPTEAANILFFLGFGSASHRIAMQPLANALAAKGHSVTFLIKDVPSSDGSGFTIQYYAPQKVAEFFNSMWNGTDGKGGISLYDRRVAGNLILRNILVQSFGLHVCENLYTDPEFLKWLRTTPKFDLVVLDALFNECGYGIAHFHGAKTIFFSVSSVLPWTSEGLGIPDESGWLPDLMLGVPLKMSFTDRVLGAVAPIFWKLYRQWYYFPKMGEITKNGLGLKEFPSFEELERNLSLVFLNTHPAQELPRALPPNVIPVGGMSWKDKKKPVPEKMEKFINEGKEGFIYVSFGSFIDFLGFPEKVQQTFIRALKQFPNIQFIWKLNKTPENLPKHILVEKWLPQQDLLLHPKIRAFITHSGIGGMTEAINSGVPLICFPLSSEQDYNAQIAQERGFAMQMEITDLKEEDLVIAIRKMITDESYKENARKVSAQFQDRPMKPVDTAVWWTEYVLRQENTHFLRSQNIDQSWWKKRQLDVWLFILLLTISVNTAGVYIFYKIVKRCFKKSKESRKSAQKQKQN